jgi:uncharacterized protein
MRIENLSLAHQDLLEPRFKAMGLEISEYTFANVFLFRHVHDFKVIFSEDVYLKGKTRQGQSYLMPTSSPERMNWEDLLKCRADCDFLFPIPKDWAVHFPDPKFKVFSIEDDSDYLYTASQLSSYAGRKLSGRRNLVKQFKELFPEHALTSLTSLNSEDALKLLEDWKNAGHDYPSSDYDSCAEALKYFSQLKLSGSLCYVGQKPVGLIMGEPLNDNIYVIHFAKALTEFKGVYQYLYQAYAQTLLDKYQMINLEQDLGTQELRQAKQAYQPLRLIEKLRIE